MTGIVEVDLDSLFRKSSKARVVAERLMTGRQQTRAELVDGLDLSMTTVPRVVEALEGAGVHIHRSTDRTRQAVYKVDSASVAPINDPKAGTAVARFQHTAGQKVPVTVTKMEILDNELWLEWESTVGRFRGRALERGEDNGAVAVPPTLLSGHAELVALTLLSSGDIAHRLGDDRQSVLIGDVHPLV